MACQQASKVSKDEENATPELEDPNRAEAEKKESRTKFSKKLAMGVVMCGVVALAVIWSVLCTVPIDPLSPQFCAFFKGNEMRTLSMVPSPMPSQDKFPSQDFWSVPDVPTATAAAAAAPCVNVFAKPLQTPSKVFSYEFKSLVEFTTENDGHETTEVKTCLSVINVTIGRSYENSNLTKVYVDLIEVSEIVNDTKILVHAPFALEKSNATLEDGRRVVGANQDPSPWVLNVTTATGVPEGTIKEPGSTAVQWTNIIKEFLKTHMFRDEWRSFSKSDVRTDDGHGRMPRM